MRWARIVVMRLAALLKDGGVTVTGGYLAFAHDDCASTSTQSQVGRISLSRQGKSAAVDPGQLFRRSHPESGRTGRAAGLAMTLAAQASAPHRWENAHG